MKNNILLLIALFAFQFSTVAQNLNSYSYVVVPRSFEFSKNENQYQLNELAKFLFEKYKFQAFFEGDNNIPADRCEGLKADVVEDSGIFSTKIFVLLKNCQNEVVFKSEEGVSREKDFKTAYQLAMREAFQSFKNVNYNYIPNSTGDKMKKTASEKMTKNSEISEMTEKDEISEKTENVEITEKPKTVVVVANPKVMQEKEMVPEKNLKNATEETNVKTAENIDLSMARKGFKREGVEYFISKTESGYNLFQKNTTEPFAALYKSSRGDEFIYSSVSQNGIGYFDDAGNLIIEILNKDRREPEIKIYSLQ